ncbi:hypothetical protein BD309DRAFT_952627 [Dichomitus squalens]|uniref:Uncharacterized protein n=1 Tax=Dichomitus squalens TaxID=114155 RepID=A0A4Q9P3E4_9APHY|nr:hypothetical protein BD309DRAFT_952627 [Dichomitus squalens]TBU60791.1 hypothetical protein BD310DRAFT_922068 [Dichomitus squalens]
MYTAPLTISERAHKRPRGDGDVAREKEGRLARVAWHAMRTWMKGGGTLGEWDVIILQCPESSLSSGVDPRPREPTTSLPVHVFVRREHPHPLERVLRRRGGWCRCRCVVIWVVLFGCEVAFLPRSVVLLGARGLAVGERHEAPVAACVGVDRVRLVHRFELRNAEFDRRDGAELEVLRHQALHVRPEGLPRPEPERHLADVVVGVDVLRDVLMVDLQGHHPERVCGREGTAVRGRRREV